jgi:hypothetical protein
MSRSFAPTDSDALRAESSFAPASADTALTRTLPWILRIGVAGCFIGHGSFGIITKAAWLPYLAVGGISEPLAWKLMPLIGTMDIAMGLLALFWPCRALFLWGAVWCTWTALLRPFSGEPFWETLERAGNYGVPIAILVVVGLRDTLFTRLPVTWPHLTARKRTQLAWTLRLVTVTLLVGHAGLGLFAHKAGLAHHYAALGLDAPTAFVPAIGAFEFILAAFVLIVPRPELLLAVCAWKLATESLFLVAGAPVWELIERFGSYTAPLALALLLMRTRETPLAPPSLANP